MSHRTVIGTAALGLLLAALTGCSSSDDDTADTAPTSSGAASSPDAGQPSAGPTPSEDTAPAKAALEKAVREYTAAYFADEPDTTYGMLSARCRKVITPAGMAVLTERAVGDYGQQDVKRFAVDELSGDTARVSYGVGLPTFDQKQQPWLREGDVWKYDAC
ncbi:hypothetical protein ACIRFH_29290 [Streptomyces sp. NPDC093586]|uniref:hypothetical protein n=1 Tax=Streptomyces sp. NPDC093586 TaxID=3366042 RepID=UPI0037F7665D